MRECSRLIIQMRRRLGKPELTLIDILNPVLFDDVVLSVQAISGYDADNKTYKAGSLADHMGTTLKQLCAEATDLLFMNSSDLKHNDKELKLKEIKKI
ncbi:hypothetical protein NQ314_021420 [Rhamnusium bicolor]|uniref:Uncharacterized protein n=1 Tax=Rhamnusium bicolor TaxID=1586634 RepID=A0AAV8WJH9_9CUCU|nr:hypothetical protein NQ314_021420 [Rhamnusium bicolor]